MVIIAHFSSGNRLNVDPLSALGHCDGKRGLESLPPAIKRCSLEVACVASTHGSLATASFMALTARGGGL